MNGLIISQKANLRKVSRSSSGVWYARVGFEFDVSKSLGGSRYTDDCFDFHLCTDL